MPNADKPILRRLARLRDRKARALEVVATIERQTAEVVKQGREAGITHGQMAKRLHVSRNGLYKLLDRAG